MDSAALMAELGAKLAYGLIAQARPVEPSNVIDFTAARRVRADAAWWARADRLQARIDRARAERGDDGGDAA
jgi:hypothetical protein